MGTYVVVAIPTNTDYVWKLSSEKVPHLTIMMLNDNMKNVSRVADYIQHTVNTTMKRFGLSVDHRDKLGSEEADVLFFNTDYCMRDLEAFRSNLLKDPDIFIAYNSIPQYPIWTPHLTLGYPSSPAKPDNRDYPTTWVSFDKIAFWTSDYEGPEFSLGDSEYSDDAVGPVAAMGGTKFMDTEEALAHFGVLGMKWGHRKVLAEAPRAAGYNYYQQNNDRLNYGNAGGDRINARINKGMDRISAQKAETTYRRRRALLIAGGAYAALLIAKHGPSIFQGIANSYVGKKATEAGAKAAAEAFSNTHGITNHKIVDLGYNAVTGVWG